MCRLTALTKKRVRVSTLTCDYRVWEVALTSVDFVILGILHALIAGADMDTDTEHRRQGHDGSVLRDQVECRRFGLEEVVRDAREGGLLLQTELPDPLLQMLVLEGSVDHASVREELLRSKRISTSARFAEVNVSS